jgi:hypothetical protein
MGGTGGMDGTKGMDSGRYAWMARKTSKVVGVHAVSVLIMETRSPHSITLMCCVVLTDYNVEHVPERQLYDAAS